MTKRQVLDATLNPTGPNSGIDRIPVLRPLLPEASRLLSYLLRIDAARTYTNWGPLVSELEARVAAQFRLPAGCVTSAGSGTAALIGAILAAAGRAGADRPVALVPAFTFVATPLAVEQCGYRPCLVDVDAESWLVRPEALQNHPRLHQVGLVVPVAPFGRPVSQAPWVEFSSRTGIPVVFDGGASFEFIGTDPERFLGEIPVALSFHATKSFSTAEGGCVATTNGHLSSRVTQCLNFGFFDTRDCGSASTNGKMSEYHAAVGLAELDDWPRKLQALREVSDRYRRRFAAAGLSDRLVAAPSVAGCYVLYVCTDTAEVGRVQRALADASIETRLWYGHGVQAQPYYAHALRDELPVTERIAPLMTGLPVAPDLSDECIERIVAAVARSCRGPC